MILAALDAGLTRRAWRAAFALLDSADLGCALSWLSLVVLAWLGGLGLGRLGHENPYLDDRIGQSPVRFLSQIVNTF